MNERIRELAKQATKQYSPTYYTQEWIQGFAKSLLDEFIEALEESNGTHSETSEYGLSILTGDIRKHFGMEEKR